MIIPAGRDLLDHLDDHSAVVGIVGLGYVGLPLAVESARSGFKTIGFDISAATVDGINGGKSHIEDVEDRVVGAYVGEGLLEATDDFRRLSECDAISICVPTPLNKTRDPDLSYVLAAAKAVSRSLRKGQLVILESTTYPGCTREVVLAALEKDGLVVGEDFFLCFSPERVDPGNRTWTTRNTPKVIGGITDACLEMGKALYGKIFDTLVPVESAEAAELVKVYENTFRMINIALANELAQACDKLKVDVWDVIDAAATKPFGFMKFTPGPGLGGHCIPLDPHYLSWKMRTLAFKTRMIELASEINAEMPQFVVRKAVDALNGERKPLNGSRVLVMGVSYKKDVGDMRESPALEIMRLLHAGGAEIHYHDPYCVRIPAAYTPTGKVMCSVPLTRGVLKRTDVAIIVTDHTGLDYERLAREVPLVVDSRGVLRDLETAPPAPASAARMPAVVAAA